MFRCPRNGKHGDAQRAAIQESASRARYRSSRRHYIIN